MSIDLNPRIEERLKAMGIDTTGMSDEDKFFNATGLTLCHDECIEKLAKEEYYVPGGAANCINEEPEHDYSQDYLTLIALEDGIFSFYLGDSDTYMDSISYSIDDGETWVTYDGEDRDITVLTTPTITTGNKVLWKGVGNAFGDEASHFESTGRFNAQGNIMSLLYGDDFTNKTQFDPEYQYQFDGLFEDSKVVDASNLILPVTTLTDYCYKYMFQGCASLITAPELPATMLTEECYENMFFGCESLTNAPELPATTLANYCYESMFNGCTSLTTAPELPATTLAESCYAGMFNGCTRLVTAPELPATILVDSCYCDMFNGCTSLITAPELPATTLANSCYEQMFLGCTNLTTAPELPATELTQSCYYNMFNGTNVLPNCSNIDFTSETVVNSGGLRGLFSGTKITNNELKNILPINHNTNRCYLPVTTLTDSCYDCMFIGCTSLTIAPELPATTLASSCYYNMFAGCTSLTTAPALPATTLASGCYNNMFSGCTSLTTAPELPATTLAQGCYYYMFSGCTSLNSIKCLATNISASDCTKNWVRNVAASGTFTKAASMSSWSMGGSNGIPSGWTVQDAN